jgi:predicted nucleic acid-binding Zn ribbon protein
MDRIKQEKIFNDFPSLYKEKDLPPSETCMCWGLDVGNGWESLIRELSSKISELDPDCVAVQVKEKFGGLRFYTGPATNEVFDLIQEYGRKSLKICENCGTDRKVKQVGTRWIYTRCPDCAKLLKR